MAQTPAGAIKLAAARLGITLEEYQEHLLRGEKHCLRCRPLHPRSEFAKDRSRGDGLTPACRASRNRNSRERYTPRPRPPVGRSFVAPRDGDKLQARRRINYFVESGILPHPNTLACVDCGHLWSEGERRHEYDHHLGYAAEHHEQVESVCSHCHHERSEKNANED